MHCALDVYFFADAKYGIQHQGCGARLGRVPDTGGNHELRQIIAERQDLETSYLLILLKLDLPFLAVILRDGDFRGESAEF